MARVDQASGRPGAIYEIRVRGELDRGWEGWLDGLAVAHVLAGDEPVTTTLTGPLPDQAALRGLLCKLWDLNLTLISVRRLEVGGKEKHQNG